MIDLREYLLVDLPFLTDLVREFQELGILLFSVFIAIAAITYMTERNNNINVLFKDVLMRAILLTSGFTFIVHITDEGFTYANEILASVKNYKFMKTTILGSIDDVHKLVDGDKIKGGWSWIKYNIIPVRSVNHVLVLVVHGLVQLALVIAKVSFTFTYLFSCTVFVFPTVLSLVPVFKGSFSNYFHNLAFLFITPFICAAMIILISYMISISDRSGGIIGGNITGTILILVLVFYLAFATKLTSSIMNGSGISAATADVASKAAMIGSFLALKPLTAGFRARNLIGGMFGKFQPDGKGGSKMQLHRHFKGPDGKEENIVENLGRRTKLAGKMALGGVKNAPNNINKAKNSVSGLANHLQENRQHYINKAINAKGDAKDSLSSAKDGLKNNIGTGVNKLKPHLASGIKNGMNQYGKLRNLSETDRGMVNRASEHLSNKNTHFTQGNIPKVNLKGQKLANAPKAYDRASRVTPLQSQRGNSAPKFLSPSNRFMNQGGGNSFNSSPTGRPINVPGGGAVNPKTGLMSGETPRISRTPQQEKNEALGLFDKKVIPRASRISGNGTSNGWVNSKGSYDIKEYHSFNSLMSEDPITKLHNPSPASFWENVQDREVRELQDDYKVSFSSNPSEVNETNFDEYIEKDRDLTGKLCGELKKDKNDE